MGKALAPVAVLALLCFMNGVAGAQPTPSLDAFKSANNQLLASIERAEKAGGELPRITDPVTRPMFEGAFNERVLSGVDKSNVGELLDICSQPIKVAVAYSLHGLDKVARSTSQNQLPAVSAAVMNRNSVTYQDEEVVALAFATSCAALEIPAMTKFWEGLPAAERTATRRQGLAHARHGIMELYAGVLTMQNQPSYSAANRATALDAAEKHAGAFAYALALEDRKSVIGLINVALASATPAERVKLIRVRDVMSIATCTGLCAV